VVPGIVISIVVGPNVLKAAVREKVGIGCSGLWVG
jgi:hypothetical protein